MRSGWTTASLTTVQREGVPNRPARHRGGAPPEDGSRLTGRPDDLGSMRPSLTQVARQPTRVVYDKLDVINVPPRQFVRKEVKERFDRDEALAPASGRYKQIVLEG